jgi:hypothetical protein
LRVSRSTTPELVLGADGQHHDQRLGGEDVLDLLDDAVEVRPDAVELVDVDDAGHLGVVGVAPVGLGLGLDAARAAEHADAAVEHLERAVDLDREIDVPGVSMMLKLVVLPEAGGGGGLDRDAALLLLIHEVGGGRAVVHLADLVDLAGELEDALGGRGLARVDVGEDADVAVFAAAERFQTGKSRGRRGSRQRREDRDGMPVTPGAGPNPSPATRRRSKYRPRRGG